MRRPVFNSLPKMPCKVFTTTTLRVSEQFFGLQYGLSVINYLIYAQVSNDVTGKPGLYSDLLTPA